MTAAGIVENYVAHDYPTEKIRKLMDINVMGTWFCALEAAKLMPEGGSVVMIGSMSGSVRADFPWEIRDVLTDCRSSMSPSPRHHTTSPRPLSGTWPVHSPSSGRRTRSESTASRPVTS